MRNVVNALLFMLFLLPFFCVESKSPFDSASAKWNNKVLREILLNPGGEALNSEGLVQAIQFIMQTDQSYNSYGDHLYYLLPSLPANSTNKLDQYLSIGKVEEGSHSLSVACDICASAVDIAGKFIITEQGWQIGKNAIREACYAQLFGSYSATVCDGFLELFEDTFAYIMPEVVKSPYAICDIILKGCTNVDHPFHLWEIPSPDPLPIQQTPTQTQIQSKDKFTIVYVADLHIDPKYAPGSPMHCLEPLCCRNSSTPKTNPVADSDKAGYWGEHHCDLPVWGFQDMLRQINESHADEIDFVVIGGDQVLHDLWDPETKESYKAIFEMVAKLLEENLPGKPIFFALGNHDIVPINDYPFPDDPPEFSAQWFFDHITNIWLRWLDPATTESETLKYEVLAGYYSTVMKPGWRLISINNNYCYFQDFFLYGKANITDPYGQMQWLVGLLWNAEKTGEKVVIVAHVPPGDSDCIQTWSWNYYRIVSRFAHVVSAQFFGHHHKDYYYLYYDAETLTIPKAVSFVGPPGTPYPLNNIAYRLYDFDSNFTLIDYRQYYADIGAENAKGGQTKMNWKFEYSARETYSLPDMSAKSWHNLAKQMRENSTLHHLYRQHYTVNLETTEPCIKECKHYQICAIYHGLSNVPASWCEHFLLSKKDEDDTTKRKCSSPRFSKQNEIPHF